MVRRLSEGDLDVWARYARDVAVLPGRSAPALTPEIARSPLVHAATPPSALPQRTPAPNTVTIGAQPAGLDKSTWTRLRTGRLAPERTLDLHGRTAQHAFHALQAFLHAAQADRVRCVEIITGRGTGEFGGVIRRELPLWLNLPQLRPMVLGLAHPHAANVGAVRVLLRKPK